jgi:hypothetical protein
MSGACEQALPGVSHYVCHFHLARDIGEDLYDKPQNALCKRMRSIEVQVCLREQRKGQTDWFRKATSPSAQLVLGELLAGRNVDVPFDQALGREVVLAMHYWILDYRSDGRRRGFPFDPYLLYLHRRLVVAGQAVDRMLAHGNVSRQAPRVLFNLQKQLTRYRRDPQIVEAAGHYERAWAMFGRLRDALRLSAEHIDHLRCELPVQEQQEIKTALEQLRHELQRQVQDETDTDRSLAQIVLTHLDKYWTHLIPERTTKTPQQNSQRTTNKLERNWGTLKRVRRQAHGRGKLTRDFHALPEEFLLVSNLENPLYLDLVLGGSLETLPSKIADAACEAPSFDAWRQTRQPDLPGQLPRRLLRQHNFVDHLLQVCQDHCDSYRAVA